MCALCFSFCMCVMCKWWVTHVFVQLSIWNFEEDSYYPAISLLALFLWDDISQWTSDWPQYSSISAVQSSAVVALQDQSSFSMWVVGIWTQTTMLSPWALYHWVLLRFSHFQVVLDFHSYLSTGFTSIFIRQWHLYFLPEHGKFGGNTFVSDKQC